MAEDDVLTLRARVRELEEALAAEKAEKAELQGRMDEMRRLRREADELMLEQLAQRDEEVTRRLDAAERRVQDAARNPTTKLLGKGSLQRAAKAVRRTPLSGPRARCVILIDLDGFKAYNDAHGHEAGDEKLQAFGLAMIHAASNDRSVFHPHGDEYAWVGLADRAEEFIARLRELLPVMVNTGEGPLIDFSYGRGRTLREADAAMYADKESKPDRGR